LAKTVVEAAQAQHTALPGEQLAATMVARLAKAVKALDEEIAELDALIEARFRDHPRAEVIAGLPGIGISLGAEFIAATGGDMSMFGNANRLATFAGVAPAPRDSGRIHGNNHRPRRYHRGMLRVFYLSSQASLRSCRSSRTYYDRKRAEGKTHSQACSPCPDAASTSCGPCSVTASVTTTHHRSPWRLDNFIEMFLPVWVSARRSVPSWRTRRRRWCGP
jgi:transposase